MREPNFLLIGAGKSGTTSLFRYLGQHPDVFPCPNKEPRFFAYEGHRSEIRPGDPFISQIVFDWDEYRALFAGARGERALGEASVAYLASPYAPERIHHRLPDVRLVAILRNPVDRAYSHYAYFRAHGIEPCATFVDALRDEPRRLAEGWYSSFCYRETGFYARHLARYDALFPRERIKLLLYDDLVSEPVATARSVFRFLDVDESYAPDVSIRHNATTRVVRRRRRSVAPMDERSRTELANAYRDDIQTLQDRLDRDLSHWL